MKSLIWMIAIIMVIVFMVYGFGLTLDLVLGLLALIIVIFGLIYLLAPKDNKYFNWIYKIL